MNWKDISSFSASDKERIPRTFELKTQGLNVTVTRHIHHSPDEWVLTCEPWFRQSVVGTGSIEEAQAKAIVLIKEKLSDILASLSVE